MLNKDESGMENSYETAKIVCTTNRYMFTNLLGLDDFMSRLASRLAVSFSFWIDEGHGRLFEISRSPRCRGGYGEFFRKFRVLAKFLKNLKILRN